MDSGGVRHCPKCNSSREGSICWKCNSDTKLPAPGWEYPRLPDVTRIRELAREVGYAIGEHGSKERDLDLIAIPWTEAAVGNYALVMHIAKGIDARIVESELKPHGRWSFNLQLNGYFKIIDLAVMPGGKGDGP